jgi:acetyl esterase/lipase
MKDAETAEIEPARARLDRVSGLVPVAAGVRPRPATVAGLHAEYLEPENSAPGKLLLYWHGGAYLMGSCRSHRSFVSHIAVCGGVTALLAEYRLAPENPFPAAVDDAVAVYKNLLADGYSPDDIVVAGDSAGGGLSVAMLMRLRDEEIQLPHAVALLSPWLDLSCAGESMSSRRHKDPWFDPEDLPHIARHYCCDADLTNPLVSPVFGHAEQFPPTYIQVGDDEILLSDSERMAEMIRRGGGQAEIEVWPGMWHVWQMFVQFMPESRQAVDRLGTFIRTQLSIDAQREAR